MTIRRCVLFARGATRTRADCLLASSSTMPTNVQRRAKRLTPLGIEYVGSGVSGGELGARHGPSMMPGGSANAWPHLKPIFQVRASFHSILSHSCSDFSNYSTQVYKLTSRGATPVYLFAYVLKLCNITLTPHLVALCLAMR